MRINLSTPLSDDKEMQRRNEVILAAIERHTEERMNDEYGSIHTDGSRSGGQPLIKTQHCPNCEAQATEIERLRVEAKAQYDRGYYDGYTHPLERSK